MSDVICPYCKEDQEINHDDGYEEGVEFSQVCTKCCCVFTFTTSISYSYDVLCQSGTHVMEPFGEPWPDIYECVNCDFFEKRND